MSEDEKGFDKFATTSLRGPKQSTREQLLCAKLWRANKSFPLRRISAICEASFYAKQMSPKIDLDMDLVDTVYKVALSLTTTKPQKTLYGYEIVRLHPVPWGFLKSKENFERFIKPWLQEYNYFSQFVPAIEDLRENRTRVSCSHCGGVLLDLAEEEKPKIKETLEEKFKDQIKNKRELLIDAATYKYRRRLMRPLTGEVIAPEMLRIMRGWHPPYKVTYFFPCPKCGGHIILKTQRKADTFWKHEDRTKEGVDNAIRDIQVSDYSCVVESRRWQLFFAASRYLSQDGYYNLVNSFVAWANPQVTRIEEEITGLVSEKTFDEFLKTTQQKEEEEH